MFLHHDPLYILRALQIPSGTGLANHTSASMWVVSKYCLIWSGYLTTPLLYHKLTKKRIGIYLSITLRLAPRRHPKICSTVKSKRLCLIGRWYFPWPMRFSPWKAWLRKYGPTSWKHERKGGDVNRTLQTEEASVVLTRARAGLGASCCGGLQPPDSRAALGPKEGLRPGWVKFQSLTTMYILKTNPITWASLSGITFLQLSLNKIGTPQQGKITGEVVLCGWVEILWVEEMKT